MDTGSHRAVPRPGIRTGKERRTVASPVFGIEMAGISRAVSKGMVRIVRAGRKVMAGIGMAGRKPMAGIDNGGRKVMAGDR